jgi:hypothetical protein
MRIYLLVATSPIIGWTLIIILVSLAVILALFTNALRDSISDPYSFLHAETKKNRKFGPFRFKRRKEPQRPFSLSRTQLAFWNTVIGSAYLYLKFCSHPGIAISFDATTLSLLGISTGITAGGMTIDSSQQNRFRHQNQPSDGFLKDILSDENGVSIPRFQQLLWSLIAAGIYLSQLDGLPPGVLPSLDTSLLILSGASGAAYLTMKTGENAGDGASTAMTNSILSGGPRAVTNLPSPSFTRLTPGPQEQPNP